MSLNSNLILIGVISAAHGIKGEFIVKSFAQEPDAIESLNLLDKNGSPFKIKFIRANNKGGLICSNPGIDTRNKAEALAKTQLFCKREDFPELADDEFYHDDLVGLDVKSLEGEGRGNLQKIGIVKAIFDFGAGDVIEITFDDGKDLMFPFNKEHFPEIHKDYVLLNLHKK